MWGAWSRARQSECNSLPTGGREGRRERGTGELWREGMWKKREDERE
jgi:hypothetical protein